MSIIDGICNYCGQRGPVTGHDSGVINTRWCPDTDACEERWQEQVTPGRGVTILTTTNTVTYTSTTTVTTRKGRTS